MKLKISADDFSKYNPPFEIPNNWQLKDNLPVEYNISDDFMRDLQRELSLGDQTNYTTMLIRLIFKADWSNLWELAKIYPAECLTIWAYRNIPDFHEKIYKNWR